jgi:hypothetical protein
MGPTWSNEMKIAMTEGTPSLAPKLDEARLVKDLERALHTTLFSCTGRITPRRVKQIAQEMAEAFLRFMQEETPTATRTYGQQLAQEGIGHRAALSLSEALRQACWRSANPGGKLMPVSGRYVIALLEGYMAEREALLLREQGRTREALGRAQGQNH